MPVTHDFEYFKPKTWEETVSLIDKLGNNAKILAGGTDMLVKIKDGIEKPDTIIDIKNIKNIDKIKLNNDKISIGAGVTFSQIINSPLIKSELYLLWESARTVASTGIRNRATITGNICSAVPSLDSGPPLLIYNANINLLSINGKRTVSISDWFKGPKKTDIQQGEVVTDIEIPVPSKPNGTCYIKLGRYSGEDLAQVSVGVMICDNYSYKIAYGAVGPIPKRISKIEEMLNGKNLSDELLNKTKKIIDQEISPITDIRASKEYRLYMASIMLERALKIANKRFNGELIEPFNYLGG